jgi:glycosyltransferase involved in cell wall biosynthesis
MTLLTIAIPTFNRPDSLTRSLDSLISQDFFEYKNVELIICDDSPSSDTKKIVRNYIKNGFPIRYFKTKKNPGYDFNWARCFNLAKSKYVYILGDDDVLVNGGLKLILREIKKSEYSVILLNAYGFFDDYKKESLISSGLVKKYNNTHKFILKCGTKLTFISAIIINKSILNGIDAADYRDSNLIQIHLTLLAMLKLNKFLHIDQYLVAAPRSNNQWGDLGLTLFSRDLGRILDTYVKKGLPYKTLTSLEFKFISTCFPYELFKRRLFSPKKLNISTISDILYARYKGHLSYYFFIYPFLYLPKLLLLIYGIPTIFLGRCLNGEFFYSIHFLRNRFFLKK